ncbi:hypothetical protein EUTSA_v100215141mg, partial [Eutrema salsugineum]
MASAFSAIRISMSKMSPFRASHFSFPATFVLAHTNRILCNSSRSVSSSPSPSDISSSSFSLMETNGNSRWRPMCLYFTHGKCTKMDDPAHLETPNNGSRKRVP